MPIQRTILYNLFPHWFSHDNTELGEAEEALTDSDVDLVGQDEQSVQVHQVDEDAADNNDDGIIFFKETGDVDDDDDADNTDDEYFHFQGNWW